MKSLISKVRGDLSMQEAEKKAVERVCVCVCVCACVCVLL